MHFKSRRGLALNACIYAKAVRPQDHTAGDIWSCASGEEILSRGQEEGDRGFEPGDVGVGISTDE